MKRHNCLWNDVVRKDNIVLAYKKARKGKGDRNCVHVFEENFDANIKRIRLSLVNKTFRTSRYQEKTIYEPKERTIYILPFDPDRIVQHALMNVVEPLIDPRMFYHSYSCRPGKGIHKGAQVTMRYVYRNDYCLKCDVSKFYPSVNHDIMMDIVERIISDKHVLWLIDDVVNSIDGETNLPIGNYMSQWLGNLYLDKLDHLVKDVFHTKDYIRYCDDFLLFGNNKHELFDFGQEIQHFMKETLKMKLSKCELFPTSHGVDFLGYRYFKDKILVRKTTAKAMKKRVATLYHEFHNGLSSPEHIYGSLQSTLGWLKWANSYNLKVALDIYKLADQVEREILRRKVVGKDHVKED